MEESEILPKQWAVPNTEIIQPLNLQCFSFQLLSLYMGKSRAARSYPDLASYYYIEQLHPNGFGNGRGGGGREESKKLLRRGHSDLNSSRSPSKIQPHSIAGFKRCEPTQ